MIANQIAADLEELEESALLVSDRALWAMAVVLCGIGSSIFGVPDFISVFGFSHFSLGL